MKGTKCPGCRLTFMDQGTLAEHVVRKHGDMKVTGKSLTISPVGYHIICWCQSRWSINNWRTLEQFREHIVERGGIVAHILELELMIEENEHGRR